MEEIPNINSGKQYTFIDLFRSENYVIEIPIIQRDYAQGRPNKVKIRDKFVSELFNCLDKDQVIDLDFVYGSISGSVNGHGKFIPLDGQQRLTTLFLLHWYLAQKKENHFDEFKEHLLSDGRSRFTYETRDSSRNFCNALVTNKIKFTKLLPPDEGVNNSLSKTIKNCPWYYLSWDHDPTIKGMLTMLDTIHLQFNKSKGFFSKLIDHEYPLITFHFLNIAEYKLTDDLYIKMNARGKVLTDFENFKAQFIQFIEDKHPGQEHAFAEKVDGVWSDLFWEYSINHPEGKTYTIDNQLLKFFDFISEMLFHKDRVYSELKYDFEDFEIIESIYDSNENLEFLIQAFDLFSNENSDNYIESIDSCFFNLFSKDYNAGHVALFDPDTNLFEKLIHRTGSFDHPDKLLFFAVIYYLIQSKSPDPIITQNLKDYVRICRNFILKINQKGNSTQKDQFVSDLRVAFYHDIINTFMTIYDGENVYQTITSKGFKFRKDNIQEEVFKAEIINLHSGSKNLIHQLEDHDYLKGDLHNFELLLKSKNKLKNLTHYFYEIFDSISDNLIVQSLLAIDDYSVKIGNCYFGGLYFFGADDKWHRIFTDKDNSKVNASIYFRYFEYLRKAEDKTTRKKLKDLVNIGKRDKDKGKWIRLFMKYDCITDGSYNIFSFTSDTTLDVERLEGTTLRSYHINSFIHAVNESDQITSKINPDSWRTDAYPSVIHLKYSAYMLPISNYWHIYAKGQDFGHLVKEFKLKQIDDSNEFKLFPSKGRDFVKIAIDFINTIYK